jgi:capsid assembly protease
MEHFDLKFWAGTEEAFAGYLMAMQRVAKMDASDYLPDNEEDNVEPSRLLTRHGDVGIISIAGPLVPGAPWYAEYAGVTGYDEIRAALVEAASDSSIGAILLDINSGGGAVNGVMDAAELIANIDTNVKPVQTYSSGMIASAAYWLGSSARRIDIGKVAEAGSIGVLTVHKEMSKMMKDMGVTATVLRAGEFKALGNQYEQLSDKAKAEIQGQLDQMYALFLGHVADARGVTPAEADARFAQGRVFIGDRAAAVGLVDGVSNFDTVISRAQGAIDKQKSSSQYGANFGKGPMVKTALTEQQIAAMAEGAPAAPQADASAAAPAQEGAGVAAPSADVNPDNPDADVAAGAQADPAAPKAEDKPSELVAFLQGQLSAAQAQVLDLSIQLRDAKAVKEAMDGSHAALRAIAVASVDRLKVALGASAGGAETLSDDALLAEHATLRAQFESKFKAGGVAAVAPATAEKGADAAVDPLRLARMKATRPAK